jgi:hypothetical protein
MLALVAGCSGNEPGKEKTRSETPGSSEPTTEVSPQAAPVRASHQAPEKVLTAGLQSGTLGIQAVYAASYQNGGTLVMTGTVKQATGAWSAQPSDKLVIELTDGKKLELEFHAAPQGNLINGPDAFWNGDHIVDYTAHLDGVGDVRYTKSQVGRQYQGTAKGTYIDKDVTYDVDLKNVGSTYFDNDSTGTEYQNDHQTTGTVKTESLELTVSETWHYRSITVKGKTDSEASRKVASQLKAGEDSYVWSDVLMQKSFKDGKPSQLDTYWKATGHVLKNGEVYGEYQLKPQAIGTSGGFVSFVLVLPGETIELEKWNAY